MILFLNGSINSGKSTVAKLLADKMTNTAVVEIDSLRAFIDWMSLDASILINLENGCLIAQNLSNHGLNVIIPYPLSQKNYEYVKVLLKEQSDLKFITLNPSLELALSQRGTRILSESELARIKHHYEIGINKPNFGTIIDVTSQTPEEITEEILKLIKS